MKQTFLDRGWCRFARDPNVEAWVRSALPAAREAVAAPENAQWLRCGDTWFAGVNILSNDGTGAIDHGPPLSGKAIDFISAGPHMPDIVWDRAQVSVLYPGYPLPMAGESHTAFRFRRDHDAAHVDGLHREGPDNRRHLREHHRFVLGIPLVAFSAGASPLVVWEGSHKIVHKRFAKALEGVPPEQWGERDLTELYRTTRKEIFATCKRVPLWAGPGGCYLVHRLALHGVSPWQPAATAGPDGRMIAYFRPHFPDPESWLFAD